MLGTRSAIGEAAVALLQKHRDYPSRTLARMLWESDKLLFKDVEHARTTIRRFRGQSGEKNREKNSAFMDLRRPPGKVTDSLEMLPRALEDNKPWHVVPVNFKKALVICDAHIPYHDDDAVSIALKEGRRQGVDCIIMLGDIADFYAISYWEKEPDKQMLMDEVEYCKRFLECVRDSFPKARIVYKEGNHEERLWRFLMSRCREFFNLKDGAGREMFSLATLLDFEEYGVELVDMKKPLLAGEHLHFVHGHEFGKPIEKTVNPARGLANRARCNAVMGHLHMTTNHTEPGLDKTMSTWSIGALCGLYPRYAPINRWNLGFGICEMFKGQWSFQNKKIINNSIV